MKAFRKNMEWFRTHYDELKPKYANKFVAIYEEEVVGCDTDSYRLMNRLRKKYGDLRVFAIEPVTDGRIELLL